jgi:hypothetical protein
VGDLECALAEEDAVVGDHPDRVPVDVAEAGDDGGPVLGLELVQAAAVEQADEDLAGVVGSAAVGGDGAVEGRRVDRGLLGRRLGPGHGRLARQRGDDRAHRAQGVGVVGGEVVDDAGGAGVQLAAAELLGGDVLPGRGFDQRRAAEEDRPLFAHDHGLVAHRRHIGAAGRAGAEHRGDLRDPLGRHVGLVEEDAAEVLAVGEDLILHGKEGAAGVDQVDAGQPVLQRHLLRPQVLLHGHRVVGAAFDGGVVGDDDDLAPMHADDPGDDPGRGGAAAVELLGGQRRELEEWAAGVGEAVDPLARQQLAAANVAFTGLLSPTRGGAAEAGVEVGEQLAVGGLVALELGPVGADVGPQDGHASSFSAIATSS